VAGKWFAVAADVYKAVIFRLWTLDTDFFDARIQTSLPHVIGHSVEAWYVSYAAHIATYTSKTE
jgi:hypothetical protein